MGAARNQGEGANGREGEVSTRMLASVTSVAEAQIAVAEGVDLVDLKNPAAGALGALAHATVREVVEAVGHTCLLSATVGDLPLDSAPIRNAVRDAAKTGVDYVKVGLFAGEWRAEGLARLQPLCAAGVGLVVVMFADQEPDFSLLPGIANMGCAGVMLDTADKSRGRLRHSLDHRALESFVGAARELGLLTGLAGSLAADDVPHLLPLGPDFLGFRGALCANAARTAAIDPAAVRRVRALIPRVGPARRRALRPAGGRELEPGGWRRPRGASVAARSRRGRQAGGPSLSPEPPASPRLR
jgi:dihydroneopterin aldolase